MGAAYLKSPPAAPSPHVAHWCEGKERFESGLLAAKVAARNKHKRREIYLCKRCGGYHLGGGLYKITGSKAVADYLIRGR